MPQASIPFLNDLVAWYCQHGRDLPWRRDPTPYRVLLSELMCQQTRVETAIPYFERFLERWPGLDDLARASEEEVLEAWSGLGYYSRARNLRRCAIAASEAGGLPTEVEGLRALPGIGPYTAGAIASIAFQRRAAVVDGNVERVLSRLDGRTLDPKSTKGRRALWERAEGLHKEFRGHPGDLNQALMELGARVCTPRRPSCSRCPVRAHCTAFAGGDPESLPRRRSRPPPKAMREVCGVLRLGGRPVLFRRPEAGLLAGLWEPLRVPWPEGESADALLRSTFAEGCGIDVQIGAPLGVVTHVFTHRRLQVTVFPVTASSDTLPSAGSPYVAVRVVTDPEQLALSTLARKLLAAEAQLSLADEGRPG